MVHITISCRFTDEMTAESDKIEGYETKKGNTVYIPNRRARKEWEETFKANLDTSSKGGYMLQLIKDRLSDTQKDEAKWANAAGCEIKREFYDEYVAKIAIYHVKFKLANLGPDSSGKAEMIIEVHPEWAPIGAKRFTDLLNVKYFDACRFHRVQDGFIAQWGIPADPKMYRQWGEDKINDDPVKVSNKAGTLSFAYSGPNARGSQMFVNFGNNSMLDDQGHAPFAMIIEGFESIQQVYGGYGNGPKQQEAKERGNDYLAKDFPKLSYIESVELARWVPKYDPGY